jgi:hypothetical protein
LSLALITPLFLGCYLFSPLSSFFSKSHHDLSQALLTSLISLEVPHQPHQPEPFLNFDSLPTLANAERFVLSLLVAFQLFVLCSFHFITRRPPLSSFL